MFFLILSNNNCLVAVIFEHFHHLDEVSFHSLRKLSVNVPNANPNIGSSIIMFVLSKIPIEIESYPLASHKIVLFCAISLDRLF